MDEKELRKIAMETIKEKLGLTNTCGDLKDNLTYFAGFTDGVSTFCDELLIKAESEE